jgi:flagellar FliL protein
LVKRFLYAGLGLCLMALSVMPLWAAEEGEEEVAKDPSYVKLSPAFVVNLKRGTGAKFLQVKAEALVNSKEAAEEVKLHMPAVRHTLIMQLSNQDGRAIRSIETREQLRKDSEAAVKKVLEEMTGGPVIEGLFFTNYVVQ